MLKVLTCNTFKLHMIMKLKLAQFNLLVSYGVTDIDEIYAFFFEGLNICKCSYEFQCALYDTNPNGYDILADQYYVESTRNKRIDKNFDLIHSSILDFFGIQKVEGQTTNVNKISS